MDHRIITHHFSSRLISYSYIFTDWKWCFSFLAEKWHLWLEAYSWLRAAWKVGTISLFYFFIFEDLLIILSKQTENPPFYGLLSSDLFYVVLSNMTGKQRILTRESWNFFFTSILIWTLIKAVVDIFFYVSHLINWSLHLYLVVRVDAFVTTWKHIYQIFKTIWLIELSWLLPGQQVN